MHRHAGCSTEELVCTQSPCTPWWHTLSTRAHRQAPCTPWHLLVSSGPTAPGKKKSNYFLVGGRLSLFNNRLLVQGGGRDFGNYLILSHLFSHWGLLGPSLLLPKQRVPTTFRSLQRKVSGVVLPLPEQCHPGSEGQLCAATTVLSSRVKVLFRPRPSSPPNTQPTSAPDLGGAPDRIWEPLSLPSQAPRAGYPHP